MSWQPIETAPRDGTRVDLWVIPQTPSLPPYRNTDCFYRRGKWYDGPTVESDLGDWYIRGEITHWHAIPEGPGVGLCQICGAPDPCHCDEMEGQG